MPSSMSGAKGAVRGSTRTGFFMDNALNLPQSLPQLLRQGQADAREMATLQEIGQTLADPRQLRPALGRALELLGRTQSVTRAFIMLIDADTDELHVEACFGVDDETARRAVYRVGEGVVGRVAETGKMVVVPKVSREPLMLQRIAGRERTAARQDVSFVCVSLAVGRGAVGVLGADVPSADARA